MTETERDEAPGGPVPADLAAALGADLHARAATASDLSFTISDPTLPDDPLVWVNPAFEKVTGYSASAVLGRNCRFLQGPETDPAAVDRIRAGLREGRTVAETLINYRADGTPFWNQLVISPVLDDDGRVTHHVGIQADVTDRIEAQRRREAELEAATDDRARLQLLARVTEGLARNLEYDAAVRTLAEILVREFSDWGYVATVDDRGRVDRLHVAVADSRDLPDAAALQALDLSWLTRSPSVRAALTGESDAWPEPFRIDAAGLPERTTPEQLALLRRLGVGTALVVPLRARNRVIGVIVLVLAEGTFPRRHVVTTEHVAHRAGLGLDNVRLYERERAAALTLQRRMLPEVPEVEGLDVAATYLPAQRPAEVGGDWFDVMTLPDGAIGLAVGDVVGHDLGAAAAMGQLRSVLRSYAWSGAPANHVVEHLDELVRGLGMADIATCTYLRLRDGRLEYSRAGHPPPMVLMPDGSVRALDGALRTPVGVPAIDDVTPVATAELPPGATLVAYSDGLVERRDRGLREGLEALRETLARVPVTASAAEARDLLVGTLLGPDLHDDVCLLVVRRPADPQP
ncbi:SpoIIE family protein phosphatase [Actinotalea sp. M2MS4P-6]|uniref:SpoIIE family protein phosphatase n=1 Tax=Actinotalea sp. M2MS4P-6 TaxID=2983762 RepID=UPI0021E42124|nr:SpoIIE family protein phosphatase [Actinotalea sp. M2MS4P-6]MCV2392856.1 SpoIIE family protein phosphatase [Actinotalea sp. M2MS4P-6]